MSLHSNIGILSPDLSTIIGFISDIFSQNVVSKRCMFGCNKTKQNSNERAGKMSAALMPESRSQ
ncbi:MAG: hypothetical protein ACI83P_001195 [Janthinobacterium sp.]